MTERRCETCVHWHFTAQSDKARAYGFCRRYPPVLAGSGTLQQFVSPKTAVDFGCGEHKASEP